MDRALKLVIDNTNRGGYKIYEYSPSVLRPFYKNYEKLTFQRRVRFLLERIKGYKVYYLEVNNEIVAYSVVSRGGGRYSFASPNDIVIGPYFVLEKFRGNHYSEMLVSELLGWEEIKYEYAYDWVKKDNVPSLRCSNRVGLFAVNTADVVGPFRKIQIRDDASGEYYILRRDRFLNSEKEEKQN